MRTIIRKLTQIGLSEKLSAYEVKRIQIFNYCNLFGFIASLVRVIYIISFSANHYSKLSILANILPLLLCMTMATCMHYNKFKTATYLSFLCFPPVLFIMYAGTLDESVRFFLGLYFIFPFFFLHRPRNIVVAFAIAVSCFLLILSGEQYHLLFYKKGFYSFDKPLMYIDTILSVLFVFSCLYSIKFFVWSYEKALKRKKNQLKELNQFKDKMFSVISHDLRSPIAATSQLIDLLKTVEMDQEEFKGYLSELKLQVDNARELMDNMLFWAKRQMESEEIVADHVHIAEIADETLLALSKQAADKGIELISEVDPAYSAFVDKNMMRVVVRNLLSNAIKFTGQGGYVKIKTVQKDGIGTVLQVEDNGVGIPEDKQALVLGNEYYTSFGTAKEKGSGLGLKICRDFIEKNNGTLTFTSSQGTGTVFTIAFPAPTMELITADVIQGKSNFFPQANLRHKIA